MDDLMQAPICNGIDRARCVGHLIQPSLMRVLFVYVLSESAYAEVSEHTMYYHGGFPPRTE